eukprot:403360054
MVDRILTDPELFRDDIAEEQQNIRKKNLKIKFLEQENQALRQRQGDQDKTVKINKQIIGALVDATINLEYKNCFELFQQEIKNLLAQHEKQSKLMESLNAQILISDQIKEEFQNRETENLRMHEGQIQELKDTIERKEYSLQVVEKRVKEYEFLLQEIAVYDDYVKSKLEELNIQDQSSNNQELKISNVVFQNKKLQLQLDVANMEIQNLRQLLEAMNDLHQNLRSDASTTDIQILNQLINKRPNNAQHQYQQPNQSSGTNDLASVKLFKRMTTLKKENTDLHKENSQLKDKLDDLYFLNQKLDEALRMANDKSKQQENTNQHIESTNVEDSTLNNPHQNSGNGKGQHRRRISFDAKFLAQASPSQVQSFKASLIEGKFEQASILFDESFQE